jgi:TfoX/Sxy family transcriptional regulator of competence genes
MDHITLEILNRIRLALSPWKENISEKRMFGGTCFLYKNKMCVGETKHRLMVRVKAEKMADSLAHPSVTPMNFTGKTLKEFIFVSPDGYNTEERLQHWIELGIAHAQLKSR